MAGRNSKAIRQTAYDIQHLGFEGDPELVKSQQYLPKDLVEADRVLWEETGKELLDERFTGGDWYLETVALLHEAGVPLMARTDGPFSYWGAGGLGLHFELQAMVKAGPAPLEALKTATINPAKFLEIEDDLGTIA